MSGPREKGENELSPQTIDGFPSGDRVAFLAVYAALSGAVRGWASRFFPDAFEREEAVQEIWLQAHRMRGAFDASRGPLRPWLRALAFNRCKEILRARGRRPDQDPARAQPSRPEDLEAADVAPDRAAAQARLREAVARFAATLPVLEARVLELALVNDQTNEDVARALAVSVRQAKYLKRKVLAKATANAGMRAALAEVAS